MVEMQFRTQVQVQFLSRTILNLFKRRIDREELHLLISVYHNYHLQVKYYSNP